MKPYYEHGGITIYHASCEDVMPTLGRFDLLLADPPYGIGESTKRANTRGRMHGSKAPLLKDYGENSWDEQVVPMATLNMARNLATWQIIWGGNYYELPPCIGPLIWDKENSGDFADGEMAWNNLGKALRIKRHLWNGMIRKGQEERFHPTQKPLDVMLWALSQAPDTVRTVIDPWMGSGTTLRACKDTGKECVGIDREERFCEISAMRLEQEVLAL